jgi:Holliday junction resolvase RusA-like endonuclease
MMNYTTMALATLCLTLVVGPSLAFHRPTTPTKSRFSFKLHETLRFHGNYVKLSEAFPSSQKISMENFLSDDDTMYLIFSLNGAREAAVESLTDESLQLWNKACDEKYGSSARPGSSDRTVVCDTHIGFPGLKLTTRVLNGFKLDKVDGSPVLLSYLIGEKQQLEGAAPVKWIYKQLTGYDKKPQDAYYQTQASASAKASICDTDDGVVLRYEIDIEIVVEFPSALVKILPMSKEKVEEQGTNSVVKTVKKDVDNAVDVFITAYKSSLVKQEVEK